MKISVHDILEKECNTGNPLFLILLRERGMALILSELVAICEIYSLVLFWF